MGGYMKREFKGQSIIDFPDSYIIVDIETTGLDFSCDLLEISAIKIQNDNIVDSFSSLVKPSPFYTDCEDGIVKESYINSFITDLTGITEEMILDAPSPEDVLPKFDSFIGTSVLVGHNIVSFDANFLYDLYIALLDKPLSNNLIDTLRLSRLLLPQLAHHRLSDISNFYNISTVGSHRAEKDCLITYQCFQNLKKTCLNSYDSTEDFIRIIKEKKQNKHRGTKASDITSTVDSFDISNPLYGKICVFTGVLEKMSRREAMQVVKDLGGENGDSVTKKTNYLILGNNDFCKTIKDGKSAKHKKAEKLQLEGNDIQVISENVFYAFAGIE